MKKYIRSKIDAILHYEEMLRLTNEVTSSKVIINELNERLLDANKKIEDLKNQYQLSMVAINNELSFIKRSNDITATNTSAFLKFKNINKGKTVVLVATGPTLNEFKPFNDDCLYCGLNASFLFNKIKLNYLFIQDYYQTLRDHEEELNNYDCEKFYGMIVSDVEGIVYDNMMIPEQIARNQNAHRYYLSNCNHYSCRFQRDICSNILGDSFSVAFPAMQFILWTNPSKIFLVGCDCSTEGHFNDDDEKVMFDYTTQQMEGWKKMAEFANYHYPKTKIISVNPVGLKGLFEDLYQS